MAEAIDGGILRGVEFHFEATHGILAMARGDLFLLRRILPYVSYWGQKLVGVCFAKGMDGFKC